MAEKEIRSITDVISVIAKPSETLVNAVTSSVIRWSGLSIVGSLSIL
jgi:hypothetical protein